MSSATYLRRDVTSPELPAGVLETYRTAVTAMLQLPPDDPRNWYRQGLLHILDCPHGNWWFLPWHRGYIGWFERICRELGNDPEFALPYWDWTASPRLPAEFFNGVLDPTSTLFHESKEAFEEALQEPMSRFWKSLTPIQSEQLARRGYRSLEAFWGHAVGVFSPREWARDLREDSPDLPFRAKQAVALENVGAVLGARQFARFASGKSAQHNASAETGLLEGGPHNLVHSGIGGFMGNFLSPIDPVFYLHHANVDRLWDVWTALQREEKEAHLPQDDDLAAWSAERFEFFHNEAGMPVTGLNAASYAETGVFDYAYQPASMVISRPPPVRDDLAGASYGGVMLQDRLSVDGPATGAVPVPPHVLDATTRETVELSVRISMESPLNAAAWHFDLWLLSDDGGTEIAEYIGPFYAFGSHASGAHDHPPVIFSVPLSAAIRKLESAGRLNPDLPLQVRLSATLSNRELPGQDSLQVNALAVEVI